MARSKFPVFVPLAAALLVAIGLTLLRPRNPAPASPGTRARPAHAPSDPRAGLDAQAPVDARTPDASAPVSKPATPSPLAPPPPANRALAIQGVYNPPAFEGPNAAELTRIDDLAVTYDAREVPGLAAYLTHESAEVRTAAVDGLVRLGAQEAAEPLRAAAAKSKDPHEAVAMLEAAAYLEIPPMPASMRGKIKGNRSTAGPGASSSEPKKTTANGGG